MRLHILFEIFTSLLLTAYAESDIPLDCVYKAGERNETCQRPLPDVTAVTPGSLYFVKLPCLDCPISKNNETSSRHYKAHEENDLSFTLTLSDDRTTLLLNDKPLFPSLSTNPFPSIFADQVSPNYSRSDLDNQIACSRNIYQGGPGEPCSHVPRNGSVVVLDFDYSAKQSNRPEYKIAWEVTFDAIGGHAGFKKDPTWLFNRTDQKMLKIVVEGTPLDSAETHHKNAKSGSTLFDTPDTAPEQRFNLEIVQVMLVMRSFTFPPSPRRTFWGRVRYFFGYDPREKDGHRVYIKDDWAWYGKKGTLKNELAKIWYQWPWELVLFIIFGVFAGVLALFAIVKLFQVVVQQRKLARWQGIDEVWARIRREPSDEEEDGLLDGEERYTDNVSTPRLTNEYMRVKPLPSKPLPDKPLPHLPLIEDI